MSTITVTKNDEGKIVGAGEKHQKAYDKFRAALVALEPGEMFTLSHWFPRRSDLHGWHFVLLDAVFKHQEQFENENIFRKWVEVGAGHCEFCPGPKGKMVAIPKSIGWEELDDADFQDHHEKAVEFMRSPACTGFLWPHLSPSEQGNMIDCIFTECEIERQRRRAARGKG